MNSLNTFAPAILAMAAVITLLLTALLAWATWRYAGHTEQALQTGREQLKAAVEQSEALQKPCVTIRSSPRQYEEAVLNAPFVAEILTLNVELLNIGTGPALDLFYDLQQVDVEEGQIAINPKGFVPHLRSGESWATQLQRTSLTNRNLEFSARYESLSGSKYETRMRIESAIIVSSTFGPPRQEPLANGAPMADTGLLPGDRYKQTCEDHRFYGDMRFKQLSLFAIVTGLLLNGAISKDSPLLFTGHSNKTPLSFAGIVFTTVLWVMEVRSTTHGFRIRRQKENLEGGPRVEWAWLSATNAVLPLYAASYFFWFFIWKYAGPMTKSGLLAWLFFALWGIVLVIYSEEQYRKMWA
jgi:hypothetical protein